MEKSKLERISELTRISRERALTEAEQEERTMLRRQYADEMCGSLKATLDHTWVVDGQGNRKKLEQKKCEQQRRSPDGAAE